LYFPSLDSATCTDSLKLLRISNTFNCQFQVESALFKSPKQIKQEIPIELQNELNQPTLNYIAGSSAHSDLGEAMLTALKPLGDVQTFCPGCCENH
jgi:hypothetical protein